MKSIKLSIFDRLKGMKSLVKQERLWNLKFLLQYFKKRQNISLGINRLKTLCIQQMQRFVNVMSCTKVCPAQCTLQVQSSCTVNTK